MFLFDLDGVLVETRALVIAGWRRFAAEQGKQVTDRDIVERMFGRRTIDVLTDVFGISPREASRMVAGGMSDKRSEVAAGAPLEQIPGATSFVRSALASGIPCALASSASRVNIELALEAIGLANQFDVVIDAAQVGAGKPAPDVYLTAARGLGAAPDRCVVFEDTAVGIDAGIAAGARCVGVATIGRPDLLARADLVIADFRGVTPDDIVDRLGTASVRIPPASSLP